MCNITIFKLSILKNCSGLFWPTICLSTTRQTERQQVVDISYIYVSYYQMSYHKKEDKIIISGSVLCP